MRRRISEFDCQIGQLFRCWWRHPIHLKAGEQPLLRGRIRLDLGIHRDLVLSRREGGDGDQGRACRALWHLRRPVGTDIFYSVQPVRPLSRQAGRLTLLTGGPGTGVSRVAGKNLAFRLCEGPAFPHTRCCWRTRFLCGMSKLSSSGSGRCKISLHPRRAPTFSAT